MTGEGIPMNPEAKSLVEALCELTDAFLSRNGGCFPLDTHTPEKRQWHDAVSKAYELVGQPGTPDRERKLAALSTIRTSDDGGDWKPDHPDAYLRALLDYSSGFFAAAINHGMKAGPAADAVNHIERAARNLHRLAVLSTPPRAMDEGREDGR